MTGSPGSSTASAPEARKHQVVRVIVGLPLFVIAMGLLTDLPTFSASRATRSLATWVITMFGLGAFYLIGEAAVTWIDARDSVTDPLWKRLLHFGLLFAFLGIVIALIWTADTLLR